MPGQQPPANLGRDLQDFHRRLMRVERPSLLDWQAGVLQGSWSTYSGRTPRYRAVGNAVYLSGAAQGGSNGQDILLLQGASDPAPPPPPAVDQFFAVATSGGTAQVSVSTGGMVHMEAGFNTWVSLDGIVVWLD